MPTCRGWKAASRRPRTSPWPSGKGCSSSSPTGCCGPSGCRRPTRTGPRWVITSDPAAWPGGWQGAGWQGAGREGAGREGAGREGGVELRRRYTAADLAVLTRDEAQRFAGEGGGDPQTDLSLAWELLYRLEPELYDRLAAAERLHPGVLRWLPRTADRIVEVGAGTGRLTLDLLDRGREIEAIEPVAPFRQILERKIAEARRADRVRVAHGFFDDLPVASGSADLVVPSSVPTPAPRHGTH